MCICNLPVVFYSRIISQKENVFKNSKKPSFVYQILWNASCFNDYWNADWDRNVSEPTQMENKIIPFPLSPANVWRCKNANNLYILLMSALQLLGVMTPLVCGLSLNAITSNFPPPPLTPSCASLFNSATTSWKEKSEQLQELAKSIPCMMWCFWGADLENT